MPRAVSSSAGARWCGTEESADTIVALTDHDGFSDESSADSILRDTPRVDRGHVDQKTAGPARGDW